MVEQLWARQADRCVRRGEQLLNSNVRAFSGALLMGVAEALTSTGSAAVANIVSGFLSVDGLVAWTKWRALSGSDRMLALDFDEANRPFADAAWAGRRAGISAVAMLPHVAPGELRPFMKVVQRQDLARASAVYSGLATVASRFPDRPLHLWEIGTGSGLLLYADRYRHSFGGRKAGPADAAVFAPEFEVEGPWLPIATPLRIASRRGCDLQPMDARVPSAQARALAWLPPEDTTMAHRFVQALEFVAAQPDYEIHQLDARDFVRRINGSAAPGVHVIVSSCVEQHWSDELRAEFDAEFDAIAAALPAEITLARVRVSASADRRSIEVSTGPGAPLAEVARGDGDAWRATDLGRSLGIEGSQPSDGRVWWNR